MSTVYRAPYRGGRGACLHCSRVSIFNVYHVVFFTLLFCFENFFTSVFLTRGGVIGSRVSYEGTASEVTEIV